jgi:hypothetical protein
MRKKLKASNRLIFIITFFLFNSFNFYSQAIHSLENTSVSYLKSNLEFLASDELEGREATTRGEKIAALYISEELEKYGVLPYGENGGYYQDFKMVVRNFSEESGIVLKFGESEKSLLDGKEFLYSRKSFPDKDYNDKEYEIIFVGYGIISQEDNYDSYNGINVKNKVVIILDGVPKLHKNKILSRNAVQKFGKSTSAKTKIAANKGAVGVIVLPNDWIIDNWSSFSEWTVRKSFDLEEEIELTSETENIPIIMLNEESSQLLFSEEKKNYEAIRNFSDQKPGVFSLKTKIRFDYNVNWEIKTSRNIIGLIKGHDKEFSDEYVTIGAHYDHEGIKGGEIYYGADDNGSGTVAILEVARRLSHDQINKRPVLVIFHAAEEKGLKGSKYLTKHSDFIDSVIVHLNFDMVGRKSEDSIFCVGASKISSELGKLIEDINARTTRMVLDYTFDDPYDPQRLYYRSDHYNYAKLGIPIAFFYDYMLVDYTKPTDTVDKINFVKLLKITDLAYNLVIAISNRDEKFKPDNL